MDRVLIRVSLVLITISAWCCGLLFSQHIVILQFPEKINLPEEEVSVAKISPDGDLISFSGGGFEKLFVADPKGNEVVELCSHLAVGWGHQWSPDGRFLAVRANEYPSAKSKKVAIEILDIETGEEIRVTGFVAPRFRLSIPEWITESMLTFKTREGLQVKRLEKSGDSVSLVDVSESMRSLARWSGKTLEVYKAGRMEKRNPLPSSREVVNSAWSPDGSHSAVELAGRPSLYVVSADGERTWLLDSKGESPAWMSDDLIVYMITEDDGHRILSGDIWISNRSATSKKNLTESFGEVALYPSAARDGTIVFTTEDGEVYRMKVGVE